MTDEAIDLHEVYAATFDDNTPPIELKYGALAYPDDWDEPSAVVVLGERSEVVRFAPGDAKRMGEMLNAAAERLHQQQAGS